MINLSDLQSDEKIMCENGSMVMDVEDLRNELETFPDFSYGKYFTTTNDILKFDAKTMIENFIESYEESGDGYEDMTDFCMADIMDEDIRKIQEILDRISYSTESFVTYYANEEIDIYN